MSYLRAALADLRHEPADATKAAALAHYLPMAAEAVAMRKQADDAAELARWQGLGLAPQEGCGHEWMPLDDASVLVEYELDDFAILCVFINGVWCDAECIDSTVRDCWSVELGEQLAARNVRDREDAQADAYADREFA